MVDIASENRVCLRRRHLAHRIVHPEAGRLGSQSPRTSKRRSVSSRRQFASEQLHSLIKMKFASDRRLCVETRCIINMRCSIHENGRS
jgi:hypothetical protein